MLIRYARVSTGDQTLDLQRDALRAEGCERIFEDIAGGAGERPALRDALGHRRAGARLAVWRLDRLGRSLKDLIGLAAARGKRLDDGRRRRAVELYRSRKHTVKEICALMGVSRSTRYAYVEELSKSG